MEIQLATSELPTTPRRLNPLGGNTGGQNRPQNRVGGGFRNNQRGRSGAGKLSFLFYLFCTRA